MKNALLVVNALLVIAVGFLLYKQFSGNKSSATSKASAIVSNNNDSLLNKKVLFAYIDMDTLQEKYTLAKNAQEEIKRKFNEMNGTMERMEKSYKSKIAGYQQKANTMTQDEAMAAQQDVQNSQQQIMEKRQTLTDEYQSFLSNKTMAIQKKIKDFLKEFNADKTFSFIFVNEPGLFYYKDTVFDITKEVVKGLNEQYASEKK